MGLVHKVVGSIVKEGEKIGEVGKSSNPHVKFQITPHNSYLMVREFMEVFGHPVYDKPTLIKDKGWEDMRVGLIEEELQELKDAVAARDLVAIADALGDLEYVVNGMALGCGIDLPEVVREIHRSNMTKLGPDGKPIYREDGKILKGEGYEPPDLYTVLYG